MDCKTRTINPLFLLHIIITLIMSFLMTTTTGEINSKKNFAQLLFCERGERIVFLDLQNYESKNIIESVQRCDFFDYFYSAGIMVWTNWLKQKIQYAKFQKDSEWLIADLITDSLETPRFIAVDWIYSHIYWIDEQKHSIEVAEIFGLMRKVLMKDKNQSPSSLALDPLKGLMFWSDWGTIPKIVCQGMDGKEYKTIIRKNINKPQSVMIDFIHSRIYWIDIEPYLVNSANFDGSGRKNILHSMLFPGQKNFPYFLTVYEESIYLTNWKWENISKTNGINDENLTLVSDKFSAVSSLRLYYLGQQPNGTNKCGLLNANCSHFCLPSSHFPGISCIYPDGYLSENIGQNCSNPDNKCETKLKMKEWIGITIAVLTFCNIIAGILHAFQRKKKCNKRKNISETKFLENDSFTPEYRDQQTNEANLEGNLNSPNIDNIHVYEDIIYSTNTNEDHYGYLIPIPEINICKNDSRCTQIALRFLDNEAMQLNQLNDPRSFFPDNVINNRFSIPETTNYLELI